MPEKGPHYPEGELSRKVVNTIRESSGVSEGDAAALQDRLTAFVQSEPSERESLLATKKLRRKATLVYGAVATFVSAKIGGHGIGRAPELLESQLGIGQKYVYAMGGALVVAGKIGGGAFAEVVGRKLDNRIGPILDKYSLTRGAIIKQRQKDILAFLKSEGISNERI